MMVKVLKVFRELKEFKEFREDRVFKDLLVLEPKEFRD